MSAPKELDRSNDPSVHNTNGKSKASNEASASQHGSDDSTKVYMPKDHSPLPVTVTDTPTPPFAPPPAAYKNVLAGGASRATAPWTKTFYLGIFAGAYLSFGGALSMRVGGESPGLAKSNPGVQSLLLALVGLPTFLTIIVCTGAELFTANCMFMTIAWIEGAATALQVTKNWAMSYFGNLAGSLIMAGLFKATGLFDSDTTPEEIATAKGNAPWGETFLRAILCNWLVCIAIWLATSSNTLTQKVFAVFLPISAFVAIGLEHSIANMFSAPLGLILGASNWGDWIAFNLIPVTLGNMVSGALIMGVGYSMVFGKLSFLLKF